MRKPQTFKGNTMSSEKTYREPAEDLSADIQQKVASKISMDKLMWRRYTQPTHSTENSNKRYHDLAVLHHIADSENQEHLRAKQKLISMLPV